ncbi:MAG: PhnD/SsuA/transferrin family substrate-binding protein [Proteobacteria bacterium]|nr:PhnD/SsuA/transferrin family substrate-binding protein [Pseudomonadota bacterium]MBS0573450.1 PhnD/SsuA/transferrin family substrate-binding protein [Pseudomonadota bacterium]
MIATLAMYDWPEVRADTDRLWHHIRDGLRRRGVPAPDELTRGGDLWALWLDGGLVLGHTCGFPYRTRLHGKVALVGTPDYGLEGAPPGYYYSHLIVRRDETGAWQDFLDRRLAMNGQDSQSGWAAPQNLAAREGRRFSRLIDTGAHLETARAVAEGRADIGAVDAVTWRLLERYRPSVTGRLRVAARTEPTPGLPLVTALAAHAPAIAAAVRAAIADLPGLAASAPGLRGLADIPAGAYLAVPTPPEPTPVEWTG